MDDLKKIHKIELDMLKVFHSICIENKLRYYAVGGTLLGAVRHKGFIPWDDDIDLAMPRSDFEKFIEIAHEVLPANLGLYRSKLNLNTLQLVNNKTCVKKGKIETPIYLDIFPFDGYPSKKINNIIYKYKILFRRMMCKLSVINWLSDRDRGTLENLIVFLGKLFKTNKLLNSDKQLNKLQELIKNYSYDTSFLVGNILGRYREREIVEKRIIGMGKLLIFEDTKIFVPDDYSKYLTKIYGDYMKLPPFEDRTPQDLKIVFIGDSYE